MGLQPDRFYKFLIISMTKLKQNFNSKQIPEKNSFLGKYQREYTNDVLIVLPDDFKIVNRNGFEYTLRYAVSEYRRKHHVPVPAFLGCAGYALHSVKKLQQ